MERGSPSFQKEEEDQEEVGDESFQNEEEEQEEMADNYDFTLEAEHIQDLIQRDTRYEVNKDVRSEAMEWLLRRAPVLRLQSRTSYLSMAYLDRFIFRKTFNKRDMNAANIRLIAVACLSLAVKMEEPKKIRSLPLFQVHEFVFRSQSIKKVELSVLNTLEWRMNVDTPFAFLDFFDIRLCIDPPVPDAKSKTEGLVMSIITDINLNHHRPSSIAAAATLMALDQELTTEGITLILRSDPSFYFLEIEDVCICYNVMQEQELKKWMEFSIFEALECKIDLIPPSAFLDYFIVRMFKHVPHVKWIKEGAISVMKDNRHINVMHHRPSSIAAAATMMAFEQTLTRYDVECLIKSNPGLEFFDIEDVCTCYNLMLQHWNLSSAT